MNTFRVHRAINGNLMTHTDHCSSLFLFWWWIRTLVGDLWPENKNQWIDWTNINTNYIRYMQSGHNLIVFKYFQTFNYADLMRPAHHLRWIVDDWCSQHVLKKINLCMKNRSAVSSGFNVCAPERYSTVEQNECNWRTDWPFALSVVVFSAVHKYSFLSMWKPTSFKYV